MQIQISSVYEREIERIFVNLRGFVFTEKKIQIIKEEVCVVTVRHKRPGTSNCAQYRPRVWDIFLSKIKCHKPHL